MKKGHIPSVGCGEGSADRRYAVDFGAHGSRRKMPTEYPLTQAEAEEQAAEWRARADTVGGTAEIHEKPNTQLSNSGQP